MHAIKLFGTSFVLLLVGCANINGYVKMYQGNEVTPNMKSIIKGVYGYRDGSLANEMVRIVEVNGRKVPHQWGVAEGANMVSVLPGTYTVKVLWVHGYQSIDYYSYDTLKIVAKPNCTYNIHSKISVKNQDVYFGVISFPSMEIGNQNCDQPIELDRETTPKLI
ncbi:MAG: hypothetical protein H7Z73_02815 [Candidatus Saccharibacteria bacterium]|nr:hypothetical protein [Moraxellaceae bacterium]